MKSSGTKTASGVMMAGPGRFFGFLVTPDGTNDVTMTIYDNASAASGVKITSTMVFAGDGGSQTWQPPIEPVDCFNGVYVEVSVEGAGTVEYIAYTESGSK
jgi:hypothetical protein